MTKEEAIITIKNYGVLLKNTRDYVRGFYFDVLEEDESYGRFSIEIHDPTSHCEDNAISFYASFETDTVIMEDEFYIPITSLFEPQLAYAEGVIQKKKYIENKQKREQEVKLREQEYRKKEYLKLKEEFGDED